MKGFLGSDVLEAAMGASFVYLLLASFCSTVNEWIATLLAARADTLRTTIHDLLGNQNIAEGKDFIAAFYSHPLITGMMQDSRHPAFLAARSFTTAILDLATPQIQGSITFAQLEKSLCELPPGDVRTALLSLIQNAAGDFTRVEANVEGWFNDAMTRASGAYKKRTRTWTLLMACLVTVALNADTCHMLQHGFAFGWNQPGFPASLPDWLARIAGWSITVAAVSLGAPFWFDLLNRLTALRPEKSRTT